MLKRNTEIRLLDPAETPYPALVENEKYRAAIADLDAVRTRSAETDRRRAAARALLRAENLNRGLSTKNSASQSAKAAALLAGDMIPAVDPKAEIAACDAEDEILHEEHLKLAARIEEIAGQLSYEANLHFQKQHEEALRAVLTAMASLHVGVGAIMGIRGTLQARGYRPLDHILRAPIPQAAFVLGNPDIWNTAAAQYRRELEKMGII